MLFAKRYCHVDRAHVSSAYVSDLMLMLGQPACSLRTVERLVQPRKLVHKQLRAKVNLPQARMKQRDDPLPIKPQQLQIGRRSERCVVGVWAALLLVVQWPVNVVVNFGWSQTRKRNKKHSGASAQRREGGKNGRAQNNSSHSSRSSNAECSSTSSARQQTSQVRAQPATSKSEPQAKQVEQVALSDSMTQPKGTLQLMACPFCSKKYKGASALVQHVESKHEEPANTQNKKAEDRSLGNTSTNAAKASEGTTSTPHDTRTQDRSARVRGRGSARSSGRGRGRGHAHRFSRGRGGGLRQGRRSRPDA